METPQQEVDQAALSADGRWLAWTVNENGFSRLYLRDLVQKRGVALRSRLPPGVYSLSWATRAPRLSIHVESPQVAGDAWRLDPTTADVVRMTESATGGLDPSRFVLPEAVSFRSWDGETIYGLLFLPPRGDAAAKPSVAARASWGADRTVAAHLLPGGSVPADEGCRDHGPELPWLDRLRQALYATRR